MNAERLIGMIVRMVLAQGYDPFREGPDRRPFERRASGREEGPAGRAADAEALTAPRAGSASGLTRGLRCGPWP